MTELPDTDIRQAMADELRRLKLMAVEAAAPAAELDWSDVEAEARAIRHRWQQSIAGAERARHCRHAEDGHTHWLAPGEPCLRLVPADMVLPAGGFLAAVLHHVPGTQPAPPADEGECGKEKRCMGDPECRWCPHDF